MKWFCRFKGLGGFRNVLAHGYIDVKADEVHKNMKKMNAIIGGIIRRFEEIA